MKENRECYVSIGEINALPWLHTIWENGEVKWRGEATKKNCWYFFSILFAKERRRKAGGNYSQYKKQTAELFMLS